MARLTVLMGAPGSGKSTWARAAGIEVVSTDAARSDARLRAEANRRGDVLRESYRRLHEVLAAGQDAVFDSTGANPAIRKAAIGIARRHGAAVDVEVLDTPVEVCVERQQGRPDAVPEAAVRRIHADVARQMAGLKYEGFDTVRVRHRR